MTPENETLHKRALTVACQFHKAESSLIDILQLIDERRIFSNLGYTSLFDYSVRALKLSESTASNFITVARKSKIIPELKMAISAGDITVSKARKITSVLTPENQAHWIGLAKTLPKQKLEKEIAKVMPETLTPERSRYVSETRIELKMGVSEKLMEKLKRSQNLVSQKLKKSASLEDTLGELVELFLSKQDPVEKAKRVTSTKVKDFSQQQDSSTSETRKGLTSNAIASVHGTRYLNAGLKHQIRLRDGFQCAHLSEDGVRCQSKRWLEIHHRVPLSLGGSNNLSNFQTLCSAHHKMFHRNFFHVKV